MGLKSLFDKKQPSAIIKQFKRGSAMDFTKYGLTDEQQSTAQADYNAEIAGLKNKNAELIEREKTSKLANEQLVIEQAEKE